MKGDVQRGLFFRGSESLPFGNEIRPARDLIRYLLTGDRKGIPDMTASDERPVVVN